MARLDRIFASAMAVGFSGLLCAIGPAAAQSQNGYGLTDLKPYAGALDRPAQSSGAPNSATTSTPAVKPRPGSDPAFSLHMFGGAMIDSRIGR
jgi:hypothetical protein